MLFLNEKTTNNAKFEVIFLKNIWKFEKSLYMCAKSRIFATQKL